MHTVIVQHIGAGACRIIRLYLQSRYDGNIQKQRKIFHRNGGPHLNASILRYGERGNLGETAAIVGAGLCLLERGDHILCRHGSAIGEGGFFQIKYIGAHIPGNRIFFAKNGLHLIGPVVAEKSLIDQREQRPVGVIVGGVGIHGLVRVVDKGDILHRVVGGVGGLGRTLLDQRVTGGGVGLIGKLGAAAKKNTG